MLRPIYISLLISFSTICITSCASTPETPSPTKPIEDVLIGRVSSVFPEQNYLLLQKYTSFHLSQDSIFYSRSSDGTTHSIKLTGQQLGQFYVADIADGKYAVSDPVFMRSLDKFPQDSKDQNVTNFKPQPLTDSENLKFTPENPVAE